MKLLEKNKFLSYAVVLVVVIVFALILSTYLHFQTISSYEWINDRMNEWGRRIIIII